ncbi:outer membrane beta-barrel protein, partial [Flavobacterium flevense]|uniref:outer membrane beta-barrel protein n=1 Tax=Flavobacterium flevense TaxID=983 RepID=UPI0014769422
VQSGIGDIKSDLNITAPGYKIEHAGAVKVGYIYSFTNHFGIGTGLEFSKYNQEISLKNLTETLTNFEIDPSTSAFVYNVTTSNYREKQTLQAIQIPLFLQYKTTISKGVDFNFRAGAKYFLPVDYKIKSSAAYVNGAAYYPDVNLTIDDLPEYGFGGQSNYSASGEYQTKGILMSMFELGFTFDVGKRNALYAAMFLENGYGS